MIDLMHTYRRDTLVELMWFENLKESSNFIQDYAFNQSKSISLHINSGHRRRWNCTCNSCCWFVQLSLKRENKGLRNTVYSTIPQGRWFVSALDDRHAQICTSARKVTSRQLSLLQGFQAAFVNKHAFSKARVAASVKSVNNINIDDIPPTINIASNIAKDSGVLGGYNTLVSFLNEYEQINAGSTVCLQLDGKGRFYRLFVSVGCLVQQHGNFMPIVECDGAHMKHPLYNGISLTLICKDGGKKNVPVAVGFVREEACDNFAWFFANFVASGLPLDRYAIFCDRGKQRRAQRALHSMGININLKFCSSHIVLNPSVTTKNYLEPLILRRKIRL